MTVLTFPSNPTNGQVYNAPNGIRYVYDGVKWVVETTTSTSEAVTNSTQDRVAPMFVDGDHEGISFTYNAGTNVLSATVTAVNGDQLVNGENELVLESTGALTLPQGGTITEGYVTSNPTIQLTPANPDVASQKLVIKGGSTYNISDNGITLSYNNNTAQVGDTLYFYVDSTTYADQTLYWWIYPTDAGIGDSNSGTVVLTSTSGSFSILIDSDDYEFTVRVSPEENNYDPASLGVESQLINADEPTYPSEYHLHLTTGDLTETCIFLGTDDHNVRTTTDGAIQITTYRNSYSVNNVWEFDTDGGLTFPGSSNGKIGESEPGVVVYSDIGLGVVTGASTPVASYAVEFTGFVDNGDGESGATLHVTAMIAGTITNGMTIFGSGLPPEGLTLAFGGVSGTAGDGGVGNYNLTGANLLLTSQSFNNGVIAPAGPKSWIFDDEGDITLPEDGDIVNGDGESFLKDIPQNYPTGYSVYPYTLQSSDRGRHILIDGSEGTGIWVPTDATSPMPIGSAIVIVVKPGPTPYNVYINAEDSYSAMTIHGAGVGTNLDYQLDPGTGGAMATLIKIGANEWMLSGTGLSEAPAGP